jgi:hypothetical protein
LVLSEANMDAFISHSSSNIRKARALRHALEDQNLQVWLDESQLGLGALLDRELQQNIRASKTVILLWSKAAQTSRWVNAEWLTAFHLGKHIIPCRLDKAPLPPCFRNNVFLDLKRLSAATVHKLAESVASAPVSGMQLPPVMRAETRQQSDEIQRLILGQRRVTDPLGADDVNAAATAQAELDPVTNQAAERWPYDLTVLGLCGYHEKNGYLVQHWNEIQSGVMPEESPSLRRAEQYFFRALSVDPNDLSAINGIGSVLLLEHELDAAEFFITTAIAKAQAQGAQYADAEEDLRLLRRYKKEDPART